MHCKLRELCYAADITCVHLSAARIRIKRERGLWGALNALIKRLACHNTSKAPLTPESLLPPVSNHSNMSQADNLAATPFDTHGSASPPQPHPVSDSSQVSLPAAQVRNGAHHTNDHTNALEANSSHTDSFKSTEKPLLKFFKQKATEPREWKTSLIRFGPLSG